MNISCSICLIFCVILVHNVCNGELVQQGEGQTQIIHTIQKDLDALEEKLKIDLNEKFSKLSAQLDENDRRVKKTLSIFEAEWTDKSKRLSDLEERQQRVEVAVMKLTKLVNEMRNPYTTTSPTTTKIMKQTPAVIPVIPKTISLFVTNMDNSKSFMLIGSPTNFKTLLTIPPEEQADLSTIQLEYVKLSPQTLLDSLQYCSKLKSLKMLHVNITGEFESKVRLPQLSEFILDQVGVLQFSNHSIFSKWSEVDEFLHGFDEGSLTSFIFFYKDEPNWGLEDISDLDTDIHITVDGVKLFGINHANGELNSMLKFSPELVRNLQDDFFLLKLAVSAWKIDLEALPETLTHLNFNYIHNIKDFNTSYTKLKEKFAKLIHLRDLNTFMGNVGNVSTRGTWAWSFLPTTLKNLTIRFSDVNYPTTTTHPKLVLDNLYFHYCKLDRSLTENYHKGFDSKNVAVTFRVNSTTRVEHELLSSILKTNATWIFIQNFNRTRPDGRGLSVFWTVENFLFECGISQYAQHFILQKRSGTWEGWNVSRDGQLLLTYQLVGTDQFVTFDTFKKIID